MSDLQTITLDFEVQGALDGLTEAPPFSPDPNNPAFKRPSTTNQIYPIVIEGNMGLIDPDYAGTNGSMGDRFLQRLEIRAATPGDPDAHIAVVDARGALVAIVELERSESFFGQTLVYIDTCLFIPQGSMLRLVGWPADPGGDPHTVRLHLVGAESAEGEALLDNYCCCEETEEEEAQQGGICDPPVIESTSPQGMTAQTGIQTLTIFGSNFEATDVVTFFVGGTDLVVPGSFNFVNSTQIEVDINTDDAPLGTRPGGEPIVVHRQGDEDCRDTFDYEIGPPA